MNIVAYKWMRCPYCMSRFPLTKEQFLNNLRFRCAICKRFNAGSWDAEADGTAIGRTAADVKAFGLE